VDQAHDYKGRPPFEAKVHVVVAHKGRLMINVALLKNQPVSEDFKQCWQSTYKIVA
jgi:hypothetical protein